MNHPQAWLGFGRHKVLLTVRGGLAMLMVARLVSRRMLAMMG